MKKHAKDYQLKYAVCVCIVTDQDNIVSVSRKNNHALIGLPGGTVEEGEDNIFALVREIKEELEITVSPHDLELCYEGYCETNDSNVEYWVSTYMYKHVVVDREFNFQNAEGALVSTVKLDEMCLDEKSSFAAYNSAFKRAIIRSRGY